MDKPQTAIKGRGAADNPRGRFEKLERDRDEDEQIESRPETVITLQQARSIISRNDSPDLPFNQSINPYQGCEHGCIYCYARPSHAYLGLSPGLDFETRCSRRKTPRSCCARSCPARIIAASSISLGANTDPYQPAERKQRITRGILEVLWEFRHPVGIVTKGSLIERDLDLLEPMAARGTGAGVRLHRHARRRDRAHARAARRRAVSPRRDGAPPRRRAACPAGCSSRPSFLSSTTRTWRRCSRRPPAAGARTASFTLLRLPWEVKDLFKGWLEQHVPLKAAHIMARIRDMRGGRENDPEFGTRMKGEGSSPSCCAPASRSRASAWG